MAKLGSFYSLCPLIDNKNLLGVSEDPEEGVVIVTLDKNLASRYKISNQRQLTCWRTKEKFTSPVVYHKDKRKYVAVFNQSYVKFWDIEDNLDKVKKYKFDKPIHTILVINNEYLIMFQSGAVYKLDNAIEERKTLIIPDIGIHQIDLVLSTEVNNNTFVGIISEDTFYWTKYADFSNKYSKITLKRKNLSVRGYSLHVIRDTAYFLTLWSDGSIYYRPLEDSDLSDNSIGELFTVVDSISSKHFVAMLSLDDNYIALFGANNSEEGAMLALYNIQFKVTQSRQPFKLFTTNTKIWKQGSNILLPVGQNLAVVPFHLEIEQLASLVGSHKDLQSGIDPDIKIVQEIETVSWDGTKIKNLPKNIRKIINHFIKQGFPESTILEEMLPDIFKQHNTASLLSLIENFSDIPEKYLVDILDYVLESKQNTHLIDKILARSFSEVLILPYLRSNLATKKVIMLLEHIRCLWTLEDQTLPGLNRNETCSKLVDWSCVLIDSNYQKIVLTKDESFLETLTQMDELVRKESKYLEDLQTYLHLLNHLKSSKTFNTLSNFASLRYSIEQVNLY